MDIGDAVAAVERSLAATAAREPEVHAWAFLDPGRARLEAEHAPVGSLRGLTVGVKDIFDTADQPTECGSPIYAGHRPRADAAAVALLRSAGAVVLGKTVTAELAWFTPGATTNPHRATHTPGGSSSGSAAAVAAGMVDLALGTQTAGSVIRPASFCGVLGFKPTFGLIPAAGVKAAAPSCDTVGLFAKDTVVLGRAFTALTGRQPVGPRAPLRFALMRGEHWGAIDDDGRAAVLDAASRLRADERALPPELIGLADAQPIVQAFEGARALAYERLACRDLLSEGLRKILDWGAAIEPEEYDAVVERAARARRPDQIERLFGGADVLVTAAVLGEAPLGLDNTGDPRLCRLWTLLGLPTISVPGHVGGSGMPIGIQLVGRHGDDHQLLDAAAQAALAFA